MPPSWQTTRISLRTPGGSHPIANGTRYTDLVRRYSRKEFLEISAGSAALVFGAGSSRDMEGHIFKTRGVVLYPADLSLGDWPERAARAGLTTIALHDGSAPSRVMAFVRTAEGHAFLEKCQSLGLHVEYELHAMHELLPRPLFERDPSLFRMTDGGDRTPDANLCVHSPSALAIVAENAVAISKVLTPTTGRHFLWGDDGAAWCRCPKCRGLSDSDQSLLLENQVLRALKEGMGPSAPPVSLAHLAYANTIKPPTQVRPDRGVFLEFAPIHRRYDVAYADQHDSSDTLEALDANLKVFPKETAQALEYWLDMSRFSGWKRPVPAIPWRRDVFLKDLESYTERGIMNVTSFAAWIDAEYARNHPDLGFIQEYGEGLRRVK